MRAQRATLDTTLNNYRLPIVDLLEDLGTEPSALDAKGLREFLLQRDSPSAEGLTSGVYKQLRRSDRTADGQPNTECRGRRLPKRQGTLATALATHADTR